MLFDMLVRRKHFTVEFYNRISGESVERFEDIPEDVIIFLSRIDYIVLIEPFVVESMEEGLNNFQCMRRYNITEGYARSFRRKYNLFVSQNGNNRK